MRHGTSTAYKRGCRCEPCVDEQNAYQRERYAALGRSDRAGTDQHFALADVPQPGAWRSNARCRTAPLSLFFVEPGDDAAQAKAICAGCPVVDACRAYALAHPDLRGIWGGLTAERRKVMRRTRGSVAS